MTVTKMLNLEINIFHTAQSFHQNGIHLPKRIESHAKQLWGGF